jgi:hypothetical protein
MKRKTRAMDFLFEEMTKSGEFTKIVFDNTTTTFSLKQTKNFTNLYSWICLEENDNLIIKTDDESNLVWICKLPYSFANIVKTLRLLEDTVVDICRNSRKKYIHDQLEMFEIMWNICRNLLRIHMMNDLSNLKVSLGNISNRYPMESIDDFLYIIV